MSRVTQPGQGLLLQLADAFVREAKLGGQLLQRVGWVPSQTIAGHDDLAQAVGKLGEEGPQSLVDQGPLSPFVQVLDQPGRQGADGWGEGSSGNACRLWLVWQRDGCGDELPPQRRSRRLCLAVGRSPEWPARDQYDRLAEPPS